MFVLTAVYNVFTILIQILFFHSALKFFLLIYWLEFVGLPPEKVYVFYCTGKEYYRFGLACLTVILEK